MKLRVAFASVLLAASASARAGEPDRAAILDAIKSYWGSIETLTIVAESVKCDEKGNPLASNGQAREHVEFSLGGNGRRAIRLTRHDPEGKIVFHREERQDGKHRRIYQFFKDDFKTIDIVAVDPQKDAGEDNMSIANDYLWLMMPFCKRIDVHLASEIARLESDSESGSKDAIMVLEQKGEWRYDCHLDSSHDWLPKVFSARGYPMRWEVRRFTQVDGRSFPAEGMICRGEKGNEWLLVRLIEAHVNAPPVSGVFDVVDLPKGVLIFDQHNGSQVIGTDEDRAALIARHQTKESKGSRTITAEREPSSWPISLGIAAASFVVLVVVGVIKVRG